jgi:hypothetical protein
MSSSRVNARQINNPQRAVFEIARSKPDNSCPKQLPWFGSLGVAISQTFNGHRPHALRPNLFDQLLGRALFSGRDQRLRDHPRQSVIGKSRTCMLRLKILFHRNGRLAQSVRVQSKRRRQLSPQV